jgi:hypothetical protein
VITGKNARATTTDFANFTGRNAFELVVQNSDFHPDTRATAGPNVCIWIVVVSAMHVRGQDGDVARHFT